MGLKDIRDIDERMEEEKRRLHFTFDRYLKQPPIQNMLYKYTKAFPYYMWGEVYCDLSLQVFISMKAFIKLRPGEGFGNPDGVDFNFALKQYIYNKIRWGYGDIKRKLKKRNEKAEIKLSVSIACPKNNINDVEVKLELDEMEELLSRDASKMGRQSLSVFQLDRLGYSSGYIAEELGISYDYVLRLRMDYKKMLKKYYI